MRSKLKAASEAADRMLTGGSYIMAAEAADGILIGGSYIAAVEAADGIAGMASGSCQDVKGYI